MVRVEHTVLKEHTFGFYPSVAEIRSREQSHKTKGRSTVVERRSLPDFSPQAHKPPPSATKRPGSIVDLYKSVGTVRERQLSQLSLKKSPEPLLSSARLGPISPRHRPPILTEGRGSGSSSFGGDPIPARQPSSLPGPAYSLYSPRRDHMSDPGLEGVSRGADRASVAGQMWSLPGEKDAEDREKPQSRAFAFGATNKLVRHDDLQYTSAHFRKSREHRPRHFFISPDWISEGLTTKRYEKMQQSNPLSYGWI